MGNSLTTDLAGTPRRKEWKTPKALFDVLDREFGFAVDAAADEESSHCRVFLDETADALTCDWTAFNGSVFCNPPYGYGIGAWVEKGYQTAQTSTTHVVMLLPSRTDTTWWHQFVMKAWEVRFIQGRLNFGKPNDYGEVKGHNASFASCVVVFGWGQVETQYSSMERPK